MRVFSNPVVLISLFHFESSEIYSAWINSLINVQYSASKIIPWLIASMPNIVKMLDLIIETQVSQLIMELNR